jgi:hypothetical protein
LLALKFCHRPFPNPLPPLTSPPALLAPRPGDPGKVKVEPRVKVIGTFPGDSHRAIIYPVAATVTAKLEADTYLSYLRSTAATKAVFDKYGFIYLWRRVAC